MDKEKVNLKQWLKKNWPSILVSGVSVMAVAYEYYLITELKRTNDALVAENRDLERKSLDLAGQVRASERENRQLTREIGNLNYQLGKVVSKEHLKL